MEVLNEVLTIIPEIVNSYDDEVVEETYKNAEFTFRSLEKSHMILEYCAKNKIPNDVADTMELVSVDNLKKKSIKIVVVALELMPHYLMAI